MPSIRSRVFYLFLKSYSSRAALVSPIYADLHGLPPLLVQVGDREILLSDSLRLADRAREAGVDIKLEVWEGMWHVWHLFAWYVPEGQRAIEKIGAFICNQLDCGRRGYNH